MAKAQITLPSGAKVAIEGTEEEVAQLLMRLDGSNSSTPGSPSVKSRRSKTNNTKQSIADLIETLVEDGFFKKPTELSAVKTALEQQGHYFARSAIPTQLLRLVKRRQLRRVKQDGQWRYVG